MKFTPKFLKLTLENVPQLSHRQGRKCRDISSIYQVLGLPDIISANDSRLKENRKISVNIGDISPIYRLFIDISDKYRLQIQPWNKKIKTFYNLVDISTDISLLSIISLLP